MSDLTYTIKEILDLQFRSQAKDFEEIKSMLLKQEANTEKQFGDCSLCRWRPRSL